MLRRDFGIADIDRFLDQHLFPSTLSPYDGALFQPDAIYTCYGRSNSTQRRRDAEESAETTKPRHTQPTLHCYPQEFCYLAQISCHLRELRYRSVLRSGYGRNRNPSVIGKNVAMRVGNFLDQPVRAQHPQLPAHGCAAAFALGSIGRFAIVEQALQVSITESVQVEFAPADRQQHLVVLPQHAQTPHLSTVPGSGSFQILGQLLQPPAVIHAGQSIRIPLRRLLRHLGSPVQVRYPSPHRPPVRRSIRLPFFRTIAPKRTHIVDRGLDPRKAAHLGVSFVVHFQRIPLDVVLDADAFFPLLDVTEQFPVEGLRHLSVQAHSLAEKAEHIRTPKGCHSVLQQQRIQTFQILGLRKSDVDGRFTLVRAPVVVHVEMLKDLLVDWIEHGGDAVQFFCPVGRQLLIHQPLCLSKVLNPRKTVVLSHVAQSRLIHLPRQPFASVQANLYPEGKPGLNPCVHETEHRMNQVVVQVQTLALFQLEIQFLGLPVRHRLETHARFHAVQHAHQSALNLLFGGKLPRNVLFARRRRRHIPHHPAQFHRSCQRGLLQSAAHTLHMRTEILEHQTAAPKVLFDSPAVGDVQRAQFSPHHQSVEPAQNTVYLVRKLCDKLLHGVPFFRDTCLETHIIRRLRTPFHFGCGSAALSLCGEPASLELQANPTPWPPPCLVLPSVSTPLEA